MSWYRDPQLFIDSDGYSGFNVYRVTEELLVGTVLTSGSFKDAGRYSFFEHLSLGSNKPSDYDAFVSDLKDGNKLRVANSQGFVATFNGTEFILSRQLPNSPFYSLPGIQAICVEVLLALDIKVSDLEKKISELTSKLEEGCGVGGGSADKEPWMTGHPVPSNWVSYDDLDVRTFPKDNHLNITKVLPKFAEDKTTNVHSARFYSGVFPIVVVNVDELIPNKEDARFDPEIWSLCINNRTSYAARKPFESEMLAG